MAARRGKGNRRRQPAGILESGEIDCGYPWLFRPRRRARRRARRAAGAVEALFDPADQIFEIVGLPGERDRPLPLGVERPLGVGLLLLAFVDQGGEPLALFAERRDVAFAAARCSCGDLPADPHQVVRGRRPAPRPCRACPAARRRAGWRCAPIAARPRGCTMMRRRRQPADALQRRQHLGDDGAAAVERLRGSTRSVSSSGLSLASVSAIRPSTARSRAAVSISA